MNIAIICFSKYQLLNIIKYIMQYDINNNKIDLFLKIKVFNDEEIEKIKTTNLFTNVILYEDLPKSFIIKKIITRIITIINPIYCIKKQLVNKYDIKKISTNYNQCIYSKQFSLSIALSFITSNKNIYMFDDGAASYFSFNIENRLITNLFYTILGKNLKKIRPKKLFLNDKTLVVDKWNQYYDELQQLPEINEKIENIYKDIFDVEEYEINKYKSSNVIYFNQPNDNKLSNYEHIEKELIEIIKKYNNSIVRMHPRTKNFANDIANIDGSNTMWEILCKYLSDDLVLVGNFSTALLTPKLFYNKEPYIIFTFMMYDKYFKNNTINDNLIQFLNKFKNCYKNKNKIFFLNDINNLDLILKDIL